MKPLVCVFAHPDDEAFGPGGTIALFAKEREVYIICVTNGDAGQNSLNEPCDLGEIRRKELLSSAAMLGVKQVFFLNYKDGNLCNNLYHEIADKITKIISSLQPDTLLTYEPRGISGHIDHVAVSMITSFVFEKASFIKKLYYYCMTTESRALQEPYFIFFPPGYTKEEIDEVFDTSSVWDQKLAGMNEHKSQKHDAERVLRKLEKLPKEEHFLVRER